MHATTAYFFAEKSQIDPSSLIFSCDIYSEFFMYVVLKNEEIYLWLHTSCNQVVSIQTQLTASACFGTEFPQ